MDLNKVLQEQTGLDLASAGSDSWPEKLCPVSGHKRGSSVPVVIRQSVLNAIVEHGQSRLDVEICGVLVGNGYRDPQGAFLFIEGSIRGEHSENQLTQVTFTSRTWSHIHQELEQRHAGLRILGWYHTHPGFGIFLSGMDLFIQEQFFNASDQLALVYDPHSGEQGLFAWQQGQVKPQDFVIDEDVPASSMNRPKRCPQTVTVNESESNPISSQRQQKWSLLWFLLFPVIAGLAFALWWFVPLKTGHPVLKPARGVKDMPVEIRPLSEEKSP